MNTKYSLPLLFSVCLSFGFSGQPAVAQQGKIVINPTPLANSPIAEPSQDDLLAPIDVTEQKLRQERALLNSVVVPEPGSDYFSKDSGKATETLPEPVEMEEDIVSAPTDEPLSPPLNDVQEYERWAAEQKQKYSKREEAVPSEITPMEVDAVPPPMPVEARAPVGVQQLNWNALEGNSIRQVLQGWSAIANVELIWQSENDFAVLNPFIMSATYERAVQKLLDQYQDNQVRPVATLHIDPETNVKTLVVRVVEGM